MKKDSRTLVVLNYAMDSENPIFSHQVEAVNRLSEYFPKVVVITSSVGNYQVKDNVTVKSSQWQQGKALMNVINFLRASLPELSKNVVVFSHMTDVQSAILSPVTRVLGIRHHLWYAHTTYSIYLRWSRLWVNSILTSTVGSCPVKGSKVIAIGQAIDPEIFSFKRRGSKKLLSGIHVGRFDTSKKIDLIIDEGIKIRQFGFKVAITQIGNASGSNFNYYQEDVKARLSDLKQFHWFKTRDSVNRELLPKILQKEDFFIHAFDGSLDKTLIEATMCGLPVITVNKEYLREFGSWTGEPCSTLSEQYCFISGMSLSNLNDELLRRQRLCLEFHSILHWQTEVARRLMKS